MQLNPHDPLLIEPFCDVKMILECEKKWRKVDQSLLRMLAGKINFKEMKYEQHFNLLAIHCEILNLLNI